MAGQGPLPTLPVGAVSQVLPHFEFSMSRVASSRLHSSRWLARALPGAKVASFPAFIQPCLALARNEVPTARGLELKLDGYRVQAHIQDGRVRLYTRGGFDWTNRFATMQLCGAYLSPKCAPDCNVGEPETLGALQCRESGFVQSPTPPRCWCSAFASDPFSRKARLTEDRP